MGLAETTDTITQHYEQQAQAIKEVEQADEQAAQSQQSNASASMQLIVDVTNGLRNKIAVLQDVGATAEQTDQAFKKMFSSMFAAGKTWATMSDWGRDMERLNTEIDKQVESFKKAESAARLHTQALSGADATTHDLAEAQHALRRATDASVGGIIRMDEQTLSGLQNAIDSARTRMQGLADDAKNTAQNLEATLAKLKGNDSKAREIEHAKKLNDLQAKLNEAKLSGNAEAEKQLQRALELQKQINAEEEKQAGRRETERKQREQQRQEQTAQRNTTRQSTPTNIPTPTTNLSASDIIASLDKRIVEHIKKTAVQEFMKQLTDELKRRPV